MKLRRVTIKNYRGIKSCEWRLTSNFFALVGSQDSTKTTLLDAIGLALSTRYNMTFTDADFFNCDVTESIVIEVVVADLPRQLIREDSHGHNRSGIDAQGELYDEAAIEAGIAECLIVRLTVDESLEPIWEIVKPGAADGYPINSSQRGQLGFFRIGDYVDQHLRWGRTSALTNLTNSNSGVSNAMVEAQRQARTAVENLDGTALHSAAEVAKAEALKLGSSPFANLRPGLDPASGAGNSALLLHDGPVPLTQFGLGSRRLLSLAIQENALSGQSIIAIDELETGLDPHRVAHLLRHLRDRAAQGHLQVLITTHAPLVVEALSHDQLFVVRSADGVTSVNPVPVELGDGEIDVVQGVMRERPSALLAQRVAVGEGATEVGLMRALLYEWDEERPGAEQPISATVGAAVTNGSGSAMAPKRAHALADLGYPTLLMIDGDVSNAADIAAAAEAGVVVLQWSTGRALEDVVAAELPVGGLQALLDLAADEKSEESVRGSVGAHLGVDLTDIDVASWIATHGEEAVRLAIGRAAKGAKLNGEKQNDKAWFKREDRGEQLGSLIRRFVGDLPQTGEIITHIPRLKVFVYGTPATPADEEPNAGAD